MYSFYTAAWHITKLQEFYTYVWFVWTQQQSFSVAVTEAEHQLVYKGHKLLFYGSNNELPHPGKEEI